MTTSMNNEALNIPPYPDCLKHISISTRGTKNLFDIFFSANDIESCFEIILPSNIDFTWIDTHNGNDKYISYSTLKTMLLQLINTHPLVQPYLCWVDNLLFASNNKPLLRDSNSTFCTNTDTLSELDDSSSINSYDSAKDYGFIIDTLHSKIDQMSRKIELREKDFQILQSELKLKDKEIELLRLQLTIQNKNDWI